LSVFAIYVLLLQKKNIENIELLEILNQQSVVQIFINVDFKLNALIVAQQKH